MVESSFLHEHLPEVDLMREDAKRFSGIIHEAGKFFLESKREAILGDFNNSLVALSSQKREAGVVVTRYRIPIKHFGPRHLKIRYNTNVYQRSRLISENLGISTINAVSIGIHTERESLDEIQVLCKAQWNRSSLWDYFEILESTYFFTVDGDAKKLIRIPAVIHDDRPVIAPSNPRLKVVESRVTSGEMEILGHLLNGVQAVIRNHD